MDCISVAAGCKKGFRNLTELDRYEKLYLASCMREADIGPPDASLHDWNSALTAMGQEPQPTPEQACRALYQLLESC